LEAFVQPDIRPKGNGRAFLPRALYYDHVPDDLSELKRPAAETTMITGARVVMFEFLAALVRHRAFDEISAPDLYRSQENMC
jgi:hypothetical protein